MVNRNPVSLSVFTGLLFPHHADGIGHNRLVKPDETERKLVCDCQQRCKSRHCSQEFQIRDFKKFFHEGHYPFILSDIICICAASSDPAAIAKPNENHVNQSGRKYRPMPPAHSNNNVVNLAFNLKLRYSSSSTGRFLCATAPIQRITAEPVMSMTAAAIVNAPAGMILIAMMLVQNTERKPAAHLKCVFA